MTLSAFGRFVVAAVLAAALLAIAVQARAQELPASRTSTSTAW